MCGYDDSLLRSNHAFEHAGAARSAGWAAFSQTPPDARSACLAAADLPAADGIHAIPYRSLGAPVLFGCHGGKLFWFQHEVDGSRLIEVIEGRNVSGFFESRKSDFAPQRIYRAKTSAKFVTSQQLDFVDVGLMPFLERESGQQLGKMIELLLGDVHHALPGAKPSKQLSRWLFQSAFWFLAARILRDKSVPSFKTVDVSNPDDVFARVARYYNATPPAVGSPQERVGLAAAATRAARFPSFTNITTESLAYVYENTLVSPDTREALGTHSTPPWLVDYVVWQLAPWIEELEPEARHLLEPACGHAAFLVAGVRLLRDLYPKSADDKLRLRYLRDHVHGIEFDDFAREIGRLSLTLADVPHPNGWNLISGDMFVGAELSRQTKKAGILLSNPPFEDFTAKELRHYRRSPGLGIRHTNKAVELLARTVDNLPDGGIFGLVVPQAVLVSSNAKSLRDRLLKQFELREICLFPDKVFQNSSVESAVILGRRRTPSLLSMVYYRRVREWDMTAFTERLEASAEAHVPQSGFLLASDSGLKLPDLQEVWEKLRSLPTLDQRVSVQKGFEFKSRSELAGRAVEGDARRAGWRRAALRVDNHPIWKVPSTSWIDYSKETIRRVGAAQPGRPQIIINYAPVSRRPWRLKAALDATGITVSSRFLVFRPKSGAIALEVLWAILNSPVANAFAFSLSGKRQTLPKEWKQFPVPAIDDASAISIAAAASRYRQLAEAHESAFFEGPTEGDVKDALLQMDSEVLRAYNLPPKIESKLLALFEGVERPGVGCSFSHYPATNDAPHLPFFLRLKLQRFHELTSKSLREQLSETDAAELRTIEGSFDDYETSLEPSHPFRKWLRSFDRRHAATRTKLDDLEQRIDRLVREKNRK